MSPVHFGDLRPTASGHERHRRLTSGEDLFRKVFLSSHDAILLLSSTAGEFLDLNPQASVMFGYTKQEFLHLPPKRTICLNEGQWELLLDSLRSKRDKWLRGMACLHRSGRIILRDILPSLVNIDGNTLHPGNSSRCQLPRIIRNAADRCPIYAVLKRSCSRCRPSTQH